MVPFSMILTLYFILSSLNLCHFCLCQTANTSIFGDFDDINCKKHVKTVALQTRMWYFYRNKCFGCIAKVLTEEISNNYIFKGTIFIEHSEGKKYY